MRFDKHILSIICLLGALAYTLWFVFAGFGNHQDPLYWLYKYEHLEGGWMAVGSLLTGSAIVKLFGAQLLPLRIAGWLCVVGAIALPYCCLLDKEQRKENLHWLVLVYILMGYGAFQEFSPGTLSVLLLSALWVTQSPVLLGLAVAARFPNILALLVLLPLWRKKSLWNIPIVALTAGLVYLLGWWLVTPAATDAAMSSHELQSMFTKLWENGGKLLGFGLMAVGVLACSQIMQKKTYITGAIIGLVVAYYISSAIKPFQWYNTDLTYLLSAFCLVIACATKQRSLYIGAAILAVATFGTDTAWLKLFPAVLCLLPVAAVYYTQDGRRFLWTALAVISVFVAIRMTKNSVGQSNLTKVQTFSSVAPYQGIAIRQAEEQRLIQYKADYDSLSSSTNLLTPSSVLAIGQEMHLMRAVTGCEAARYNEFWSNIYDSVYTAKYREIIQAEHPIVFCSFSPQFKTKPVYQDRQSAMEQMLREEGYREIDRSKYKYMIYIPAYE